MLTETLQQRLRGIEDASRKGRKVRNLYRLMYTEDLWLSAYGNIYANQGATTQGVDDLTLDGMSKARIQGLIGALRDGSYRPKPVRRTYIPKANGKRRPLGIPSGDDKLVQEVARILLERIYEPVFLDCSHGFRKGRSCHTALQGIPRYWNGTKWLVNVDIAAFFDSTPHRKLLDLLKRRIEDKRFLKLIEQMLQAGYCEDWQYHKTYSGTPQGGLVSPVLSNVVLHELDLFMEALRADFNEGKSRRRNPEYVRKANRILALDQRIEAQKRRGPLADSGLVAALKAQRDSLHEAIRRLPSMDQHDPDFKRLQYIRYADDHLTGVIGTREDALDVAEQVTRFIEEELELRVQRDKTRVSHIKEGTIFLGYEIRACKATEKVTRVRGKHRTYKKRTTTHLVNLYVPKDVPPAFCHAKGYGHYTQTKATQRPYLLNASDIEIVATYNAELRGLAQYYALACDVKKRLGKLFYLAEYSLFATLANKQKTTTTRIIKRIKVVKEHVLRYTVGGKQHTLRVYKLKHLERRAGGAKIDVRPNSYRHLGRAELITRLEANRCEYCGHEGPCEVHHVRKLKDLQSKKEKPAWAQLMIARRRKTLVLCKPCHVGLHSGTLPDVRHLSKC